MDEITFFDKLMFMFDESSAMVAIVLTMMVAIIGKMNSAKDDIFSIVGSLIAVLVLVCALVLQFKAAGDRFIKDIKLQTKLVCIERKLELITQSKDIHKIEIEACETYKRLIELDKNLTN